MRKNPPAETETVNGWSPESSAVPISQETKPVEVEPPKAEVLPGRQTTTEGLERPQAPVRVPKAERGLKRIVAVDDPNVYAIVTAQQFHDLSQYAWKSVRSGHLYRLEADKVIWLHRQAANCKRSDRFVGFISGDQRDCRPNNLRVFKTKERAKECTQKAVRK